MFHIVVESRVLRMKPILYVSNCCRSQRDTFNSGSSPSVHPYMKLNDSKVSLAPLRIDFLETVIFVNSFDGVRFLRSDN